MFRVRSGGRVGIVSYYIIGRRNMRKEHLIISGRGKSDIDIELGKQVISRNTCSVMTEEISLCGMMMMKIMMMMMMKMGVGVRRDCETVFGQVTPISTPT
jgi:hypothetical protein